MHISDLGLAFLERHEGVVLRAYRDPVGVWTIGAGLTRASGVVDPRAGMIISRAEASRLLQAALRGNYEPAVALAMPGAAQHEFDGALSFHFNTGAIGRASWVAHWRKRDWAQVWARLKLWSKGGGKVLPGLERRRKEEFDVMRYRSYGIPAPVQPGEPAVARIALTLSDAELANLRAALVSLGYAPGDAPGSIRRAAILRFQSDHALTVDGVVGRATLSTVQRMIDARRKGMQAGGAGLAAGAETQVDALGDLLSGVPAAEWLAWAALGLAALWMLKLAWSYRDALAARVQGRAPTIAATLRRF